MPYANGRRTVKAEIANKPQHYLLCRDQQHRWNDLDVQQEGRAVLRIIQKCEVCTGERTQLLSMRTNSYGEIIKSWISHYPDGYLMPKGFGRLDRRDRGEIRMARRGY
jgi:endo-1,4-beta-D-glucanase Y